MLKALPARIALAVLVLLALLFFGTRLYYTFVVNPKVVAELRAEQDSERAQLVMLLTLPTGNTIPVNYLLDGPNVFVGADGRWWRQFRAAGQKVDFLLRGTTYKGQAVAITNDPAYRDKIFTRLRPTVPRWLPEWSKGVLIKITIVQQSDRRSSAEQAEQAEQAFKALGVAAHAIAEAHGS